MRWLIVWRHFWQRHNLACGDLREGTLFRMLQFYEAYRDDPIVSPLVA